MTPSSDPRALPLRPAVHHILIALLRGPMHGLGIAEEIEATSDGTVELGPGTLYRSLSEMAGAGLIRPVPAPTSDADPRRKYYGITAGGRELLTRETDRLERLVAAARVRHAAPERA